MQEVGSPTDSSYSSIHDNEATEHIQEVGHLRSAKRDTIESPLTRLNNITLIQDDVLRTREDLLVERSKTRLAGEAVRMQRMVTGNVEGEFLNVLRGFHSVNAQDLPPAIKEAYGKIMQERDRLGSIEDDYFEAERSLAGAEWTFMQKERMLYQFQLPELLAHLNLDPRRNYTQSTSRPPPPPEPVLLGDNNIIVHDAPPPPPPQPLTLPGKKKAPLELREQVNMTAPTPTHSVRSASEIQDTQYLYQSSLAELDRLRKEFDSLRPEQAKLLDLESSEQRTPFEAIELRYQSTKLFEKYSTLLMNISEKEVEVQRLRQLRYATPNIQSDFSRRMSDEWILDCVKSNAIERKLYKERGIPISNGEPWDKCCGSSHTTELSSLAEDRASIDASDDRPRFGLSSNRGDVESRPQTKSSLHSSSFLASEEESSASKNGVELGEDTAEGIAIEEKTSRSPEIAQSQLSCGVPRVAGPASEPSDRTQLKSVSPRRSGSASEAFGQGNATRFGEEFRMCLPHHLKPITC